MPDKPWKQLEREVARLLGGSRYPANSGGRVDVESSTVVAQVKHVRTLSLAALEALAVEMERIGEEQGKIGVVVGQAAGWPGQGNPRAYRGHRGGLEETGMDLQGQTPRGSE